MPSTDDFIRMAQCAAQALSIAHVSQSSYTHAPSSSVILSVPWADAMVCRALEVMWMRYAKNRIHFDMVWVDRHEATTASPASPACLQLQGASALTRTSLQWNVRYILTAFVRQLPQQLALMKTGWRKVSESVTMALTWPLAVPADEPAAIGAVIGRMVMRRHRHTHALLVREGPPQGRIDVFWRWYLQWHQANEPGGWADPFTPPTVLFGRIQPTVYYMLVRRTMLEAFLLAADIRGTSIQIPGIIAPQKDAATWTTVINKDASNGCRVVWR